MTPGHFSVSLTKGKSTKAALGWKYKGNYPLTGLLVLSGSEHVSVSQASHSSQHEKHAEVKIMIQCL